MRKLTRQLLDKSKGAFILSVELYNKPTIDYRNESFSMLFTNAWELLLKAKLYEDSDGKQLSIFRPKKRNQKRQSKTLDECLDNVFQVENDPIKNNVQFISELRNEATHLIIREFDPYYSRAFQSGVLNYLNKMHEWFSIEPSLILPPGFLALVSSEQLPDMTKIQQKFSREEFKRLLEWESRFMKLQSLGSEAAVSVQHRVALVKNPKKADVILSPGADIGSLGITVIERTRDLDETHPNRANDIVNAVNQLLSDQSINSYDLQAYLHVNGLKNNNNDHHWKTRFNTSQYSNELIGNIFQAIETDPASLQRWRKQYSSHIKQIKNKGN